MTRSYHPVIGNTKYCFVCKQYKDLSEFHIDRHNNPSGHKNYCKICSKNYQKDYQHQYYLDHKDELLPKHRISAIASYRIKKERLK